MRPLRHARWAATGVAAACACACASVPPPAVAPPPPSDRRLPLLREAREQAQAREAAGDLDGAIWSLRVAEALDADPRVEADKVRQLQARRTARAAALADQGRLLLAQPKPDVAAATASLSAALAIDPGQEDARAALRRLDTTDILHAVAVSGAGGPGAPRPTPAARRASGP